MERQDYITIDIEITEKRLLDIFNQESVIHQVEKLEKENAHYLEEGLRSLKAPESFYKLISVNEIKKTVNAAIRVILIRKAILFTVKYNGVSFKTALLRVLTQENFKDAIDYAVKATKATIKSFTNPVKPVIGLFQ